MKKKEIKVSNDGWIILPVLKDVFRKQFKRDEQGDVLSRNVYVKTRISNEAFILDGIIKIEDNFSTITGARLPKSSVIYYNYTKMYYKIAISKKQLMDIVIDKQRYNKAGFKLK